MGWYRSLVRPPLFALPPETAHRTAHLLLGVPLPWERIGGVRAPDPTLHVELAGIELANPVGLAAGFDKSGTHLDALGRMGFGYVVGGTFTRRPRRGNARPRVVRYRDRASMANAMGLPNPGAEAAAGALRKLRPTGPRIASVADQEVEDVLETHALLEPHVDAVELNVSCPNVSWGRDRDNEAHLATLLRELGSRRVTPIFVKLPPFRTDVEREVVLAIAGIAQREGANALTCSNTRPVEEPRLEAGSGGLSGRDLLEGTIDNVRAVRSATEGEMPINACGGIGTGADALACLEAGATTVQVYTALVFEGPRIVGDICSGLAEALRARGVDLATLVSAR
jgi:dihydroorotate dehydrogenase